MESNVLFRLTTVSADTITIFRDGTMVHEENQNKLHQVLEEVTIRKVRRIVNRFMRKSRNIPEIVTSYQGFGGFTEVEIPGRVYTVEATEDKERVNCRDVFVLVRAIFDVLEKYEWIAFACGAIFVLDKNKSISHQIDELGELLKTSSEERSGGLYDTLVRFLIRQNKTVYFLPPERRENQQFHTFLLETDVQQESVNQYHAVPIGTYIQRVVKNGGAKIKYAFCDICFSTDYLKIFLQSSPLKRTFHQ